MSNCGALQCAASVRARGSEGGYARCLRVDAGKFNASLARQDLQATDGAMISCARFMAEVGAAEQVPLSAGGLPDSVVAQRRADVLARF